MPQKSVKYRKQTEKGAIGKDAIPLTEAIGKVQEMAKVKVDRTYKNGRKRKSFDQTVELAIHLGIDPKQADQALRGSLSLPKGIGKTKTVIAFCEGEMAEKAKAAGAAEANVDELVEKITGGWMDFDVAVAHPSVMGKIGKLGRTLGPTGKMPSPKSGTVTQDVETAVKEFAAGKVEYRNDDGGNLHVPVGKASFAAGDLLENIEAFLSHVQRIKPATTKGTYVKKISISATMTPGVAVAHAT